MRQEEALKRPWPAELLLHEARFQSAKTYSYGARGEKGLLLLSQVGANGKTEETPGSHKSQYVGLCLQDAVLAVH